MNKEKMLTTEELATRLDMHPVSLRKLRTQGKGPPAVVIIQKCADRRVRYRLKDVIAWEKTR